MIGILCVAGTPIPEMTNDKSSATPTASPAAMAQISPLLDDDKPGFIIEAAFVVVVVVIIPRRNARRRVPTRAATNCKRTPPNIGSIDEDDFLMNKLYNAYDVAQATAGRNHVRPKVEEADVVAEAATITAPPRRVDVVAVVTTALVDKATLAITVGMARRTAAVRKTLTAVYAGSILESTASNSEVGINGKPKRGFLIRPDVS